MMNVNEFIEKLVSVSDNENVIVTFNVPSMATWIVSQCNLDKIVKIKSSNAQFYKHYQTGNSVINIDSKTEKKKAFMVYPLFSYKSENYQTTLVKKIRQPTVSPWTSFPLHFDVECDSQRNTYILEEIPIEIHFVRNIYSDKYTFIVELHLNPKDYKEHIGKIEQFIEWVTTL